MPSRDRLAAACTQRLMADLTKAKDYPRPVIPRDFNRGKWALDNYVSLRSAFAHMNAQRDIEFPVLSQEEVSLLEIYYATHWCGNCSANGFAMLSDAKVPDG